MSEERTENTENTEQEAAQASADQPAAVAPDKNAKKRSFWKEVLSYIEIFAVAFIIAYVLTHFLIINCRVPTGSMLDTIQLTDRIIGSRLSYISADPQRGDIIIFPAPDDETKIYIKRVIGLPGETVEVKGGRVYINGSDTPLEEPYLNDEYLTGSRDFGPYTVPEDSYFMLGDHRNDSADSRVWNNTCVKKENIMGKALFIYFPFQDIKWLDQNYSYELEAE